MPPVPGFDGLDGVLKCLFQNALADGPEHEAERPSFEVLALAYHDGIHIGHSVGPPREGVDVARATAPDIRVGGLHDDAVGIGPVVVEALPDAARALGDVGVRGATVMHLEVVVRAVAKELRAARPEVDQRGEELLGRRGRCLVQMNRGHQ